MNLRKKNKEQSLILYEKYKYDHHLNMNEGRKVNEEKARPSMLRRAGNLLVTFILLGMIFFSTVGVITLLNPQMRELLIQVLGS